MDFVLVLFIIISFVSVSAAAVLWRRSYSARERLKALTGSASELLKVPRPSQAPSGKIEELKGTIELAATRLDALEAELGIEREKTNAILSTINAGILLLDKDRQVVMLNDTAKKIFKVSGENGIGKRFINLARDHELDSIVQKCLETKQKHTGGVQLPGTRQYLELSAAPLSGGVLVLVQDLTSIRLLEKSRKDFIANISHELRTPIASCKAIVETLQNGAIKDKSVTRDFLQRMHVEVDKLTQMVNEMGELSRIESGELPLKLEKFDLPILLNRAVDRLRAQADRALLKVSLDIPPDLPRVTIDEYRIEQVLVNLIHNAIKFTRPNGKIVISAKIAGDSIQVSVSDTGIGIPAEDLGRIFERFYKVDKARSGGGTGLGLAIAKHIVQAHGGTIQVESVEGKGSTFTFTIPLSPP